MRLSRTSSVLGSLWPISDEATSGFIKEFYTNLKKFDKAEALRQAQVKMIHSKELNNPFYWGALNLTGSF
jgi:CHAT domain-containing protein